MKKIWIFFIAVYSFAYISATNGMLGKDTFLYTNGGYIKGREVKIDGLDNLKKNFKVSKKIIVSTDEFGEKTQYSINSIRKKDIFNYIIFKLGEGIDDNLFVDNSLCKVLSQEDNIFNPLLGDIPVTHYSVNCNKKGIIFSMDMYNYFPVKFVADGKTYSLKRIINSDVIEFNRLKKELKVKLNNFNFFKESIFATYKVTHNYNTSFLKAIYKLEDRKNNIFSVTLKANLNILDIFQKISSSAKSISYLFTNNNKLYEWQRILYLRNNPILRWIFEEGEISLIYLDENGKEVNSNILSSKLPYDIGGVWYLVSFMDKNNISYEDFSYLTNTRFEGQINKVGTKKYEFKVFSGNVLVDDMIFELDKYSRVIKVNDKKKNIVIKLKGEFLSNTILKNRETLKNFFQQKHLKEINDKK